MFLEFEASVLFLGSREMDSLGKNSYQNGMKSDGGRDEKSYRDCKRSHGFWRYTLSWGNNFC